MLKKLILENWKSFRYAELPLDPLTVLIGTNASGKSNVVEALEFLQRIVIGEDIKVALAGDKTLPSIRGGVEWATRKGENEFKIKALVSGDDDQTDYLYNLTIETQPSVKISEEYITKKNNNEHSRIDLISKKNKQEHDIKSKDKELPFIIRMRIKRGGIGGINISINPHQSLLHFTSRFEVSNEGENNLNLLTSVLENIFVFNPIPSKMRDYSDLSEYIASDGSNIAGVLAALSDDKKAEVENTLSDYIKDLPEGDIKKVWAEKVGRFGTDAMLYCQEEWKPGEITEIDARSMSDGTLRFLAILTALLTRPEGSQIVIEEIDNGLHPSRAALLVKILKEIGTKRNIDILLTTHNPALLDAFGSEIVPFVVVAHRDSETGESKLTLLEDIDNFPKLFASYSLGQMTTKGAIERSLSHGE
ncbi:DNA replication and repair protein RecF [Dolichospermum sp. UHCC 0315A]|uniref:AAA family ATPase n=1 Tax=Dolichospermum sp. UHCC 0315A TaxID=1914871 RepID=UPI0011E76788|nr:ATP-binding protein [Dolichospermum sp. UHCC 0315A]QEI40886.1 DNA replication and repair protein RecF [Dolichospermum sp. UHCC 0315A]